MLITTWTVHMVVMITLGVIGDYHFKCQYPNPRNVHLTHPDIPAIVSYDHLQGCQKDPLEASTLLTRRAATGYW